jgi:hypothetical protein
MKIGYQLKQVRERLAKGLVDKGILRTEKRNFLLFDMATHPVADGGPKDEIRRRVRAVLTNRTVVLPATPFFPDEMEFRYTRTIAMLCAAYAANVLENALTTLSHEARERAFAQVDELLAEYSQWPFAKRTGGSNAVGANLEQVIRDEISGSPSKELSLEVRVSSIPATFRGTSSPLTLLTWFFHAYRWLLPVSVSLRAWILLSRIFSTIAFVSSSFIPGLPLSSLSAIGPRRGFWCDFHC